MESSLAPRGTHGDLVSGGVDPLAHLRTQNGMLEPQTSTANGAGDGAASHASMAQLRMQHGKQESCLQARHLEANGRQVHGLLEGTIRDSGAISMGRLSHGGNLWACSCRFHQRPMVLTHCEARTRGALQPAVPRTMRSRAAGALHSTCANKGNFGILIIVILVFILVIFIIFCILFACAVVLDTKY